MRKGILLFLSATVFFIQPVWGDVAKKMPTPATDSELQALIQSVDLSYWAGVANYLWTCTPRYFTLPMYNAKNEIQKTFDQFKQKKKNLTLAEATTIATILSQPIDYKSPGLSGVMCRVNLAFSSGKKPWQLQCLFIMLDARYLARLLTDVANNSGKKEVVPQNTIDAIQALFNNNCTKS